MNVAVMRHISEVGQGKKVHPGRGYRPISASTVATKGNKKMNVPYPIALRAFADRLSEVLTKVAEGSKITAVAVHTESGRKFDKVFVTPFRAAAGTRKLKFFVERETGHIYGPKSQMAPNPNHYFGTIYKADAWDWSKDIPECKNPEKAGVVQVGSYGEHTHYEPA